MNPGVRELPILRCAANSSAVSQVDAVSVEEPIEFRIGGEAISITMRTPGHDDELAAGFLLTEGMIQSRSQILEIAPCPQPAAGSVLNLFLTPEVVVSSAAFSRQLLSNSSCGICGKSSMESIYNRFPPVQSAIKLAAAILSDLPNKLAAAQQQFSQTGGLHAAALFNPEGSLLVLREDIGRHNAVDKVIGWALFNLPLPLSSSILMVSGRVSFEIVAKAVAAGVPVVASISAPSTLAIELAIGNEVTLAGFVRGQSFNLYSRPDRLTGIT
ncbi:MAG: formate dehydrogenase accessory sulfurtransferase FdhD [Verrucomicrobiota bacterium]|nr:formate dehydrogenase accessory sulfurtransferase FdhD [Verrucomicrobiota bacterium]